MLKIIVLGLLVCIGGAVAFALYAAWRITKMGQAMGRGGAGAGGTYHSNDYITTTGTTIHDQATIASIGNEGSSSEGYSAGESVGATIGESISDFGSSDSGSSDSGGGDSGGGDSGGSSD